ncbi:hypothetical protein RRG08_062538, partial [Elysia crispata]
MYEVCPSYKEVLFAVDVR